MIWFVLLLTIVNAALLAWILWRIKILPRTPEPSLLDLLDQTKHKIDSLTRHFQTLNNQTHNLDKNFKLSFSSWGLVRFSAFGDLGANQSFSLCLLNPTHNGFIITSIYTKDGSRLYIKPIVKSKSPIHLSPEEQEALAKAKRHLKLIKLDT
ncbi:MAG: DUF4446 family protein [bacterium]|nr:DUF4446 family protein [bacterium]